MSIHILKGEEVLRLKHRDFIYTGDPVPELNERQHAAFLFHVQMSLLFCLEKRNLLTCAQRERCATMLENQYSRIEKRKR